MCTESVNVILYYMVICVLISFKYGLNLSCDSLKISVTYFILHDHTMLHHDTAISDFMTWCFGLFQDGSGAGRGDVQVPLYCSFNVI